MRVSRQVITCQFSLPRRCALFLLSLSLPALSLRSFVYVYRLEQLRARVAAAAIGSSEGGERTRAAACDRYSVRVAQPARAKRVARRCIVGIPRPREGREREEEATRRVVV